MQSIFQYKTCICSHGFLVACITFIWFVKSWATSINEYKKTITMFVSPIDCWVNHMNQIKVWCHWSGVNHYFQHQVVKIDNLCNLKSHVVTYPMFVCPIDIISLPGLRYKFWISLFVSSLCESIYVDLCNHTKNNGQMFQCMSVDTIDDVLELKRGGP